MPTVPELTAVKNVKQDAASVLVTEKGPGKFLNYFALVILIFR